MTTFSIWIDLYQIYGTSQQIAVAWFSSVNEIQFPNVIPIDWELSFPYLPMLWIIRLYFEKWWSFTNGTVGEVVLTIGVCLCVLDVHAVLAACSFSWGIFQSCDAFRPTMHKWKYLMHYINVLAWKSLLLASNNSCLIVSYLICNLNFLTNVPINLWQPKLRI